MKPINPLTSACRYCRYYQPEGRRGGMCQQLSAPVKACWKACSLAIPAFATSWASLEDAWSLPVAQEIPVSAHLNSNVEDFLPASVKENVNCSSTEQTAQALVM
ncbi:hypothetical protein WJM97_16720 [Okeanomitos corallinicola TIOX110]|uniref:Uncharacterized protein n=1 Tax=Okeanomitos corallinicola TIOX110 TaxID=3133117 RepID=A0ABZ2URG1_9CYAN